MKPPIRRKKASGTPSARWLIAVLNVAKGRRVMSMAQLLDELCMRDACVLDHWLNSLPADPSGELPGASMRNGETDDPQFFDDVCEFGFEFAADACFDRHEAAKHLTRLLHDHERLETLKKCLLSHAEKNGKVPKRRSMRKGAPHRRLVD